jgi:hypothetical protein
MIWYSAVDYFVFAEEAAGVVDSRDYYWPFQRDQLPFTVI